MIVRRGSTYWVDTRIGGKRLRFSLRTTDRHEAERRAPGEIAARLAEDVEKAGTGLSLADGFQRLMDEEWYQTSDVAGLRFRIEEITSILGAHKLVADITRDDLLRVQRVLAAGSGRNEKVAVKAATVNRKMAVLKRLLNVACEDWCEIPYVPKVRPVPTPKLKMRGCTEAELVKLGSIVPPEVAEVIKFLAETGLRRGEWDQLQWKHIDFDRGYIHLIPDESMKIKTGSERRVPMTASTRALLEERKARGLERPFADVGKDRLRYQWDRARSAMGLDHDPGFVIHSLRHTCATRLVDKGVPTSTAQKWLGHSTIQTTEKYLQQSDETLKQYTDLIEVDLRGHTSGKG